MGTYVGVDLAWNNRAATGLATVDSGGRLVASTSVTSDAEIDEWLAVHAQGARVIAIDAPLVVTNPTGQRECERLVTKAFGRYDSGCHSSSRSLAYMNPPRAETLAARHRWQVDPHQSSGPVAIEVYPHAAMIGLFRMGRILKYKRGPVETRRDAMVDLLDRMAGLTVLGLESSARWREIRAAVTEARRPMHLDRVEDEVDAVLCAHLAWLWEARPDTLTVYGDATAGYIVAPPPPTHPASPRVPLSSSGARVVKDVDFTVHGTPATFATAGEAPWRSAVTAAALAAMAGRSPLQGRLRVSIDFVTPPRPVGHPGWDLDNLIKPTIDALGPVIGPRPGNWRHEQPDDERVDEIRATKRALGPGDIAGARIRVQIMATQPDRHLPHTAARAG